MYFIHLCRLNQQLCYDLNILLLLTTILSSLIAAMNFAVWYLKEFASSLLEYQVRMQFYRNSFLTNTVVVHSSIPPTPTLNVFLCVEQGNDRLEHSNWTTSFEDYARSCKMVVKNVTCTERIARFVMDTGLAQHTVFPFKRSALRHTFLLLHTNCFTQLTEYTSVQIQSGGSHSCMHGTEYIIPALVADVSRLSSIKSWYPLSVQLLYGPTWAAGCWPPVNAVLCTCMSVAASSTKGSSCKSLRSWGVKLYLQCSLNLFSNSFISSRKPSTWSLQTTALAIFAHCTCL